MNLFYDPDLNVNSSRLNEEESFHCSKVLRFKEGDIIHVTNGKGDLFESVINKIEKKGIVLEIRNIIHEYGKCPYYIHIGIAPTKNIDRFEWFLEKATEIGVDEITPIYCAHSERTTIKPERLEKVVIAAMKQSLKTYKPIINQPIGLTKLSQQTYEGLDKFIAVCESDDRKLLKNQCNPKSRYMILIGPEGDFSNEELIFARSLGFQPVSLGNSRLRTETAGVVACHICNLIND